MTSTTRLPGAEGASGAGHPIGHSGPPGRSAGSDGSDGSGPAAPSGPSRSRRRNTIVTVLAAATVCVVLGWIVAFSSVLGVKSVSVRGTQLLTIASVRAAAGIRPGTPLVRLDVTSVARRVEALPIVASASVHLSYPNTVVITIVERIPLGYLESGSRFTLVDKTGDQFRTVPSRPRDLPLFAIASGSGATATGQAVANVAASLPASLLARIASIQAFDPNSITLLLTDQRVVSWGSAERNAEKARILPTLLTQPGTQFNITDPGQVYAH